MTANVWSESSTGSRQRVDDQADLELDGWSQSFAPRQRLGAAVRLAASRPTDAMRAANT